MTYASISHPLAADRDAVFSQFGVNPRRAVRAAAASVNLPHGARQVGIGLVGLDAPSATPRPVAGREGAPEPFSKDSRPDRPPVRRGNLPAWVFAAVVAIALR